MSAPSGNRSASGWARAGRAAAKPIVTTMREAIHVRMIPPWSVECVPGDPHYLWARVIQAGCWGTLSRVLGSAGRARSLPDAEAGEDPAEEVVGGHLAEDRAQRVEGLAQLEGDHFAAGVDRGRCAAEGVAGLGDERDVAGVEREARAAGGGAEGELVEARAERVQPHAGFGGDADGAVRGRSTGGEVDLRVNSQIGNPVQLWQRVVDGRIRYQHE